MRVLGEGSVGGFKVRLFRVGSLVVGIPTEIGPRILHLAHAEAPDVNLFGVVPEFAVETPEGRWRIFGGHRLWTSPEAMPRTYSLDDKPVRVEVREGGVVVEGNPEPQNSVRKRIVIRPRGDGGSVEVVHEVENIGRWPIRFACWAISVMSRGGFAVVPVRAEPVDERGLLPDRVIALWPYTDLRDERLILGTSYVIVRQDPRVEKPLKIGVRARPSWAAYWAGGYLFVKEVHFEEGAPYPDFQSSVEVYTNNLFLELESLGPLREVAPGGVNRHVEIWRVIRVGELKPSEEDAEKIESILQPAQR